MDIDNQEIGPRAVTEPPLTGVKIIDLSLLLPGPLCSMYLADLGAEVIKIENPRAYDATRAMGKEGHFPVFELLNRNKKAITLNLKKKQAKPVLYRLLADADILLEGFRPDALNEMGLGYQTLKQEFPNLIYCGISGYGTDGPYKDLAGHDANYLALSGVLGLTGIAGGPPSLLGAQIADIGGGTLTALSAILAALYRREKTGYGQKIDISMMEGSLQFISLYLAAYLSSGKLPERGNELLSGKLPNYKIYAIQENRYVVLAALEERFFRAFLRQAKIELKYPYEELYFEKISQQLEQFFFAKSLAELQPLFEHKECCLSPIRELSEVLQCPHLQARKILPSFEHQEFGSICQPAAPFRFSDSQLATYQPAPGHGQHNQHVYTALGYTAEELAELKQQRII